MIGEHMYSRIKSNKGKTSVRKTAKELNLSPGTVQKYFHVDLAEANQKFNHPTRNRKSQYEVALAFIEEKLSLFPQMPGEVLHRKVLEKYPLLTGKARSFRSFLKPLREKYKNAPIRIFHPVKTNIEDGQVQVDIGEINLFFNDLLDYSKVYFVVFVFSYSRKMYISYQDRAYNTDDFIKAHLESFQYFGCVGNEYVYDQTKLVVINEKYREVWLNKKFHQFTLKNQFQPVICEGYDPQSKGKVERAISYIKSSFLECEEFKNIEDVRKLSFLWLNETANCRIHRTTGRRPVDMFEEERPYLNSKIYLQYINHQVNVDKTGLINYNGNQYSVPYIYQGKKVAIHAHEGKLYCYDITSDQQIAEHLICLDKFQRIIDKSHYICPTEKMEETVKEVMSAFSHAHVDANFASSLIQRIKEDNHNYARNQLIGLIKLVRNYPLPCWRDVEKVVFLLPKVKMSVLTRLLDISYHKIDFTDFYGYVECRDTISSSLDRSLDIYMKKIKRGGKNA
jgi:transposase